MYLDMLFLDLNLMVSQMSRLSAVDCPGAAKMVRLKKYHRNLGPPLQRG